MANGETRKAIKESYEKAGEATARAASDMGDGVKRLTIGLGRGLKDLGRGTFDAILHPKTIPEKLEHAIDVLAVQPVHRTIDFFDESTETLRSDPEGLFKRRIRDAQRGAQKLKVVFAAPLKPMEFGSFVAREFPKSDADALLIEAALTDNFVFSHLSEQRRARLIGAFEAVEYKRGSEIIKEGDVGDYFYVIGSGEVDFVVEGANVGSAGAGGTFGELALLYQAPRAATCVAQKDCQLFRLDQEHFRRILMMQAEDQVSDVVKVLRKVPYFQELGHEKLSTIAANLHIKHYKDGEVVAKSDDEDWVPMFSIIKEGSIYVSDIKGGGAEYKELTFGPGEFFGEAAIVTGNRILATVKAIGDVVLLTMTRETFVRVVGDNVEELVQVSLSLHQSINYLWIL
jgi:cAMP-dependent protein kinase regulator